jgi:hypothetical protein
VLVDDAQQLGVGALKVPAQVRETLQDERVLALDRGLGAPLQRERERVEALLGEAGVKRREARSGAGG